MFYGWIVLACLCCAGFARQGPAVATLSIFVEPLTRDFGWSRTALSGAASLGGLLAAIAAPLIGPVLDRRGSRLVLCAAVLVNGVLLMLLSLTPSLLVFYLLFCVARMNWAAPFELGLYGALNNWFVRRRATASSILTLAQAAGLVAMPLAAQIAIVAEGWRAGWLAIGAITLLVGFVPIWLFLVRRPEDLGLLPDGAAVPAVPGNAATTVARGGGIAEPAYSRRQALGTGAFWLLLLYTVLVYPVQAGVSLHQAPFLIERGIDPTIAATIVSTFSLTSALATLACGALPRAAPIRYPLAATGAILTLGVAAAARGRDGARGLHRGRRVRLRHRGDSDPAADRLGRLFRARAFRRDPRHRAAGAGAGSGRGAGVLGCAARPDRQLHGLAAMLPGPRGAERCRGSGRPAAGSSSLAAPIQRCRPERLSGVAAPAGSSYIARPRPARSEARDLAAAQSPQ